MSGACGASGMRCRLPYIHTVDDHDRWAPIVVGGEGLVVGGDGGGCGEIIIHHSSFIIHDGHDDGSCDRPSNRPGSCAITKHHHTY